MASSESDIPLGHDDDTEESPIRRYARRTHGALSRRSDPLTAVDAAMFQDGLRSTFDAERHTQRRGGAWKSMLVGAAVLPVAFLILVAVAVVFLGPPDRLPVAAASLQRAVSAPVAQIAGLSAEFNASQAGEFSGDAMKTAELMAAEADAAVKVGGEALLDAAMAIGLDGDRVAILTERSGQAAITVYDIASGAVVNTLSIDAARLGDAGVYARKAAAKAAAAGQAVVDQTKLRFKTVAFGSTAPRLKPSRAAMTGVEQAGVGGDTGGDARRSANTATTNTATANVTSLPQKQSARAETGVKATAEPFKAIPGAPVARDARAVAPELDNANTAAIEKAKIVNQDETVAAVSTTSPRLGAQRPVERTVTLASASLTRENTKIATGANDALISDGPITAPSDGDSIDERSDGDLVQAILPSTPSLKFDRLPYQMDDRASAFNADVVTATQLSAPLASDINPVTDYSSTEALNRSAQAAFSAGASDSADPSSSAAAVGELDLLNTVADDNSGVN